uniref:uncharacterized protein LOC117611079 n=1 Tax=Osmia lignaria TaxID=473952 RepID=UPI0014790CB4|nr:uncharacterized protein LOC117611079 [Osmia lignaria]XP_034195338.1 uncharacterized protein LOC117611503 [Osmia lignaria]
MKVRLFNTRAENLILASSLSFRLQEDISSSTACFTLPARTPPIPERFTATVASLSASARICMCCWTNFSQYPRRLLSLLLVTVVVRCAFPSLVKLSTARLMRPLEAD